MNIDIDTQFQDAIDSVRFLKTKPKDDELLILYGLFKQAKFGDNNKPSPWSLKVVDKAKWQAWYNNLGMSSYSAKTNYINFVKKLTNKYGSINLF